MKVSNILQSDRKSLALIYLVALVVAVIVFWNYGISEMCDTRSYLGAGLFLNGNVDICRTPVYPLVCYVARKLSAEHIYAVIFLIQICGFLISIYYFRKLCEMFMGKKIVFIATLVYVIHPSFCRIATWIMTESLSTSVFVILCYYILLCLRSDNKVNTLILFILSVFIVFIRPSFIFLLPLLLVLWMYVYYKKRTKIVLSNLILHVVVIAMYFGYCCIFQSKYGVFTMSSVSTMNKYYILRQHNLISVDGLQCQGAVSYLKKQIATKDVKPNYYGEFGSIYAKYGFDTAYQITSNSIKAHPIEYFAAMKNRFFKSLSYYCLYPGAELGERTLPGQRSFISYHYGMSQSKVVGNILMVIERSINISMLLLYQLALVYCILWLRKSRHGSPRIELLMAPIFTVCMCFISVIGAQDDFSRLIIPVSPLVILFAFQCINAIKTRTI